MGVDIYPPSQPSGMALGYAEVITSQGSITTEVDITGLAVTITVPTGRRIRITGRVTTTNTGTNQNIISIKEGATFLSQSAIVAGAAATAESQDFYAVIIPTAGTHTYKITASAAAGTAATTQNANNPASILVEDITGTIYPAGTLVTAGIVASEAWTPYVPTFGNFTLGNGTVTARYMKYGRMVDYRGIVVMGTTSSWSGSITISIPIAVYATDFHYGVAHGDSGAGGGFARTVGLTEISFPVWGNAMNLCSTGNSAWTATIPWTWANGYAFGWQVSYESLA